MRKIIKSKFFLIIFFFLVLNIVSYLIILKKLDINIYNKDYSEIKSSFSSEIYSEISHPYFGFFEFDQSKKSDDDEAILFNNITKIENDKNNNNYIKILFLGGSPVTSFSNFYDHNKYDRKKRIKKVIKDKNYKNLIKKKYTEQFSEQNFIIFNGASIGFKQPQQLFKLYYLNFLGYKFDYIIDISGHHELVHPFTKNIQHNLPVDWPRGYFNDAIRFSVDYSCVKNSNKLKNINSRVPIFEALSLIYIIDCKKNINPKKENNFYKIKSYENFDKAEIINQSISIWQKSVEEINFFAIANDAKFISVIMPNQYLKNSKKLSDYEKNNLLNYKEYGDLIENYYQKLDYLENSKIKNKLDLRQIFKKENSTMYSDSCCRYSQAGIEKILDEIINKIKN